MITSTVTEARRCTDSHLVIDGRRWRRTDPSLPEPIRQRLVDELMAARRAVGRASDDDETAAARRRVHQAKIALGERGPTWWEPMSDDEVTERARALVNTLSDADSGDRWDLDDARTIVATGVDPDEAGTTAT